MKIKVTKVLEGFMTLLATGAVLYLGNKVRQLNNDEAERSWKEQDAAWKMMKQKEEMRNKREANYVRQRRNMYHNKIDSENGLSGQMTERSL